ncbi:hypothetical protein [Alterisphingorhabdus coralli]|uniref:Lipoprotein n=1 Tax=Alterisphingorhabdus coralli TaxID=3071408 RepID=A0AA97F975_9SPHN|nr:hypothetical protein [Parasphingorhabdus sp. SCSIO 66989]WOE75861.1 hypothetical protein RB602_03865 [Parasphingorhabdus sp. SCSIO 66989]
MKHSFILFLSLLLVACSGANGTDNVPGNTNDKRPYDGIAADEVIQFAGSNWRGEVSGGTPDVQGKLVLMTPDDLLDKLPGERVDVTRFAGRGGLSYSGELSSGPFTLVITPGDCSDGMSDRGYPFVATMQLSEDSTIFGCAWTERQPFTGPEAP